MSGVRIPHRAPECNHDHFMDTKLKDIVILYHADCPDGFGSAFAAWKKFGDAASYVPVRFHDTLPIDATGKEVYIIDFSYPANEIRHADSVAKKLVTLDHHIGAQADTEAAREHVFDNDRSGATIAWNYFHPNVPTPRLFAYLEDNDLWRFTLPHSKEVSIYLGTEPRDFIRWDELLKLFQDEAAFQTFVMKGSTYREYGDILYERLAAGAEEVEFAGYRVLAVNAPRIFRSQLGHILAKRRGPFGIVWYYHSGVWHLSLRGDGTVNLSEIAKQFGGNGHHNAAAIDVPFDRPLPFKRKIA